MLFGKIFLVLIVFVLGGYFVSQSLTQKSVNSTPPPVVPTPSVQGAKVKYPQDFTIVLVGDSMTERLGNSDEIRANLKKYYPEKTVEVLNYGFGATNILSLEERLTKATQHGREFRPILDIDFDLIIIESFGNNPLSHFSLAQGLSKQNQALDKAVKLIKNSNPEANIAFLATISPSKVNFAKGQVDLSPQKRVEWVNERVAYTKNHLDYAKKNNIPYIDVFTKSLTKSGDGNMMYIDKKDNIHPSPGGIYLISQEIADFIFVNKLME